MTLASDLIADVRNELYSGAYQESNALNGAMLSTDTSFNVRYPLGSMQMRGAIVAIDLELIRVWEFSGTSVTFADRGVNGSTAAAHSDRALIEVLPKFSQFRVLQEINKDLDDLSSPTNGLYQIATLDITYNPAVQGYDMAGVTQTQVLGIQEVRFKEPGPLKRFPILHKFDLARNMATTDFASGLAIIVKERAYPGLPLHVRYRSTFSHLVNLSDDVLAVSGLPVFAHDLPVLGAMLRLTAPREIKRNFTESQADPKLLEDIPAGSALRSYQGIAALRQARIAACADELNQQFGTPMRMM